MRLLKSMAFGIGVIAAIIIMLLILGTYIKYGMDNNLEWEMIYIPVPICMAAWFAYLHYKYSK